MNSCPNCGYAPSDGGDYIMVYSCNSCNQMFCDNCVSHEDNCPHCNSNDYDDHEALEVDDSNVSDNEFSSDYDFDDMAYDDDDDF